MAGYFDYNAYYESSPVTRRQPVEPWQLYDQPIYPSSRQPVQISSRPPPDPYPVVYPTRPVQRYPDPYQEMAADGGYVGSYYPDPDDDYCPRFPFPPRRPWPHVDPVIVERELGMVGAKKRSVPTADVINIEAYRPHDVVPHHPVKNRPQMWREVSVKKVETNIPPAQTTRPYPPPPQPDPAGGYLYADVPVYQHRPSHGYMPPPPVGMYGPYMWR